MSCFSCNKSLGARVYVVRNNYRLCRKCYNDFLANKLNLTELKKHKKEKDGKEFYKHYMRQCKRCSAIFKTPFKTSRVCRDCQTYPRWLN